MYFAFESFYFNCDVDVCLCTHTGMNQCSDVSTDVTEEMKVYELSHADLESLISNPCQTRWTLNAQPSPQFYADLHQVLKKRRVPMNEIGMI